MSYVIDSTPTPIEYDVSDIVEYITDKDYEGSVVWVIRNWFGKETNKRQHYENT
jgi:hypothetical protein